ncbi:MAG: hypothetical protein JNL73_15165 [Anaerolineales bacterium]|nr:hypothetical protein [Anaerolineales bacterium]
MSDLLDDIRLAIDSFAIARARDLLREALKSPTAETYFLAAQVALDEDQKTRFLEQAVALDPFHEQAVTALGQQKIDAPPVRNVSSPAPVPEYVTARAKLEAAALYRFPWPKAPVRTHLVPGAQLALVERTESGQWLNVLYLGTANRVIVGWLPAQQVERIALGETPVNLLDLPISEFQHNTRDDIVDLTQMLKRANATANGLVAGGIGLVGLGLIWALLFSSLGSAPLRMVVYAISGLAVVLGVGGAAIGIPKSLRFARDIHTHLGWKDMSGLFARLDRLRRSKQDLSETQMEHQARLQAMALAGNVLTKVAPEFKDLVALARRK